LQMYPWFLDRWLSLLRDQSSASSWRQSRSYVEQKKVQAQIGVSQVYGTVIGDTGNYTVYAKAETPLDEELELAVSDFQSDPHLCFLIYQRKILQEEVLAYPSHLGFRTPQLVYQCSCQHSIQPCVHALAVTIQIAEQMNEDYSLFLQLCGLDWDAVISFPYEHAAEVKQEPLAEDEYGLVPLTYAAPKKQVHPRRKELPPFWTSSFSYQEMMGEIYTKVKEGKS
jgi:uncharacterized Zn finger protein